MAPETLTLISTLAGVALGGTLSFVGQTWGQRQQRNAAIDAERRAREVGAATRASEMLATLLQVESRPDEAYDLAYERRMMQGLETDSLENQRPSNAAVEEWERQRDDLLLVLEVSALHIRNKELRDRLTAAHRIMSNDDGPWRIYHIPESRSRSIACRHALEAIGASLRGDSLPAAPKLFTDVLEAIDIDHEIREREYQKQVEWARGQRQREPVEAAAASAERAVGTELHSPDVGTDARIESSGNPPDGRNRPPS